MSKITRIEALEDNGGGLHIAVFSGESCTHFFGGFEHGGLNAPSMQDEIKSAAAHGVMGWDGNAEDPAAEYASMTSHQYGWKLIAEWDGELTIYEDGMGVAGHRWARLPQEN